MNVPLSPGKRILVVDDHIEMARVLADSLADAGYSVEVAGSGPAALRMVRATPPELVLTDLRMDKVDGLDLLDAVRSVDQAIPVLIMTAFGAIESAVEAIRRGAYHYITKPLQLEQVLQFVERALTERRPRDEPRALSRVTGERTGFRAMLGRSAAMQNLYDLVERVAHSSAPALILGESGSGKELVARALHSEGPRRDRPFVPLNCTAVPEALLESELFGHVRGAFTGAMSSRRGLFLEADGGTLFLDEVGDMPASLQAKLLRVLEDGQVRAVGADGPRSVDVRVIAATHQPLEDRVQSGQFRADLFYRLNVVPLQVPPLRERQDDIPLLTEHFLAVARTRNPASPVERFSGEVMAALARHDWPGNVRELENLVERLVIVTRQPVVEPQHLQVHAPHVGRARTAPVPLVGDRILPLRQLEDEYISWVLASCDGSKARAAALLGVDVSTLYRRERSTR